MLKIGIMLSALAFMAMAGAATASDFKDKTITLYVAASPGGGYAVYARSIARHWGRSIPGNPDVIVRHMQGAEGLVAANYLANRSKKDGSEILASYQEAVTTTPLTSSQGVLYDPTKFTFIGSAAPTVNVCVVHKRAGISSLQEVMKRPVKLGASHHRSLGYSSAYLMNNMFDTKFEIFHGYPSNTEITLAMERGEIDGACSWPLDTMRALKPEWLSGDGGIVNIIVQIGLKSDPALSGKVPLMGDFAKSQEDKDLIGLVTTPLAVGRPYIAPPDVPADITRMLRASFLATMKDDAFLKEIEKQGVEVDPMSGEDLEALVKRLFAVPKETVARMLDITTKSDRVKLTDVTPK